jgi:hypothetical protein
MKEGTMHVVVRWLMRHVILLLSEEWVNAHREVETMQAAYRIQALCDAELRVFKVALADIERMQIEAARAKARLPAAGGLIDEMLQERMQHLAHTVQKEAIEKRTTVLKTAR